MAIDDYLERFQKISRIKADPELVFKWEWTVRWYGDKKIRQQLASARRTKTSLLKAKNQFSHLRAEHELAINAAAGALAALTSEMEKFSLWAKAYHTWFCKEHSAAAEAELEAFAAQRWGSAAATPEFKFECALIDELATTAGKAAFAAWMHSCGKFVHIAATGIKCPVGGVKNYFRTHDYEPRIETHRAEAAWTIQQAESENKREHIDSWNGTPYVQCAFGDYQAYLTFRREVTQPGSWSSAPCLSL